MDVVKKAMQEVGAREDEVKCLAEMYGDVEILVVKAERRRYLHVKLSRLLLECWIESAFDGGLNSFLLRLEEQWPERTEDAAWYVRLVHVHVTPEVSITQTRVDDVGCHVRT